MIATTAPTSTRLDGPAASMATSPKPTRRVLSNFTNEGDGWLGDAIFAGMLTYTGAVAAGKAEGRGIVRMHHPNPTYGFAITGREGGRGRERKHKHARKHTARTH
jgi:hypothetical protein